MRKSVSTYGSSLFLALAPGTVAVLLPWWLTGWRAGDRWQPLRLVVGGLYRRIRNPMYVAIDATIAGQALLLARPALFVRGGCAGLLMWAFARWCEEPDLARGFGADHDRCREAVPGWWPRLRPWDPDSTAY